MELDDLKKSWQRQPNTSNQKNMEELQHILKEKTSKTLLGISKNYEKIISMLFIGITLNILLSPFLHWILGDEGPVFRITFSGVVSLLGFIILFLFVLFFYWMKYKSFNPIPVENDLRPTLENRVRQLKRSFRQEVLFLFTFFFVLFIVGRGTSQYLGNGDFWDILRKDVMLSLFAGIAVLWFYVYKRKKYYKKHVSELQHYLAELG